MNKSIHCGCLFEVDDKENVKEQIMECGYHQEQMKNFINKFQQRGYCQGCGWKIDKCDENPCRVRKILLDRA